jgi:hypothetical protein
MTTSRHVTPSGKPVWRRIGIAISTEPLKFMIFKYKKSVRQAPGGHSLSHCRPKKRPNRLEVVSARS